MIFNLISNHRFEIQWCCRLSRRIKSLERNQLRQMPKLMPIKYNSILYLYAVLEALLMCCFMRDSAGSTLLLPESSVGKKTIVLMRWQYFWNDYYDIKLNVPPLIVWQPEVVLSSLCRGMTWAIIMCRVSPRGAFRSYASHIRCFRFKVFRLCLFIELQIKIFISTNASAQCDGTHTQFDLNFAVLTN